MRARIKKRKIVFYIFVVLAFMSPITALVLYFSNLSEKTFPKQVEFKIDNPKIEAKVNSQIQPLIKKGLKEHWKRSKLLDDITHILSQYDIIDSYHVRLGFDEKLIVEAHVQKPVMAVHVKNGDIFVIGSAMRIIEKNPNTLILQNMPNIYFPEMQIKWKGNSTVHPQNNDPYIDYAWFLEQINLINDNFQWYNHRVQKIVWTNSIGFALKLHNSNPDSENDDLLVYLGHNNIDIKVEKLKTIAMVLKQKNFKPHEIDLDLTERAFIK